MRTTSTDLLLVLAVALRCGGDPASPATDTSGETGTEPTTEPTTGAGPDTSEASSAPTTTAAEPEPALTYWRDIYPVLQTHCVTCHREGGIGPFDLADPATAAALAPALVLAADEGSMPPFLPGPLTPPLLNERRLSDAEKQLLADWTELGAPLGDPADRGPEIDPIEPFDLGAPDLSFVVPSEPYSPDKSLADDYRCFVVPLDEPVTRAVIGYRVTPGNDAIAHHMIANLFPASDLAAFMAKDAETPDRAGWPCFSQTELEAPGVTQTGVIGFWVPGVSGVKQVTGTMRPLPADSIAVVQLHYNTAAWDGVTPDQTAIDLHFAPQSEAAKLQPLSGLSTALPVLEIPFGDPMVVAERTFTAQQWTQNQFTKRFPDGEAWAVGNRAHMHLLATSIRITMNEGTPDEQILLDIPRWDFHWQSGWQYQQALPVRETDALTVRCTYDNTAEHRAAVGLDPNDTSTVHWGEGTADEMCGGGLDLVDNPPNTAGEACSTLINDAPAVEVRQTQSPLPTGAGGTISDGIYHLEDLALHAAQAEGPTGYLEHATIEVRGDLWSLSVEESGDKVIVESRKMATEGNTFVWTRTCPGNLVTTGTYDADDTQITLYYSTAKSSIARRLTRVGD